MKKLMKRATIAALLVLILIIGLASALPNASFTTNRTGDLGQIPRAVLFNSTVTEPANVLAYNLSMQGTGNDTVWRNGTSWSDYVYTYELPGNFTPYIIVHYTSGLNTSQVARLNASWVPNNASFTTDRHFGYVGQMPQIVVFYDTSTYPWSIRSWNLSVQGTSNDTVWYNTTLFPTAGYSYTYAFAGNFTPYLNITLISGTNQSVTQRINVTYLVQSSFTCTRPTTNANLTHNLNGTRPFTLVCNETGNGTSSPPILTWEWSGSCIPTNKTTNNISMTCNNTGYQAIRLISGNGNGTNTSQPPVNYIWVMKGGLQDFSISDPVGTLGNLWQWLLNLIHGFFGGAG